MKDKIIEWAKSRKGQVIGGQDATFEILAEEIMGVFAESLEWKGKFEKAFDPNQIAKRLWNEYYKEMLDRIDLESKDPPPLFPDFPDWLDRRKHERKDN